PCPPECSELAYRSGVNLIGWKTRMPRLSCTCLWRASPPRKFASAAAVATHAYAVELSICVMSEQNSPAPSVLLLPQFIGPIVSPNSETSLTVTAASGPGPPLTTEHSATT